jgi:hypothetical protein
MLFHDQYDSTNSSLTEADQLQKTNFKIASPTNAKYFGSLDATSTSLSSVSENSHDHDDCYSNVDDDLHPLTAEMSHDINSIVMASLNSLETCHSTANCNLLLAASTSE